MIELRDTTYGKLCDISTFPKDHVLLLRATCPHRSLSQSRVDEMLRGLYKLGMASGTSVVIIGSDVAASTITELEAVELRLCGDLPSTLEKD